MKFSQFLSETKQEQGSYVGVRYSEETKAALIEKAKSLGVLNITPSDKIHTTITYSRKHIDIDVKGTSVDFEIKNLFVPDVFKTQEGESALVWKLYSNDLQKRFAEHISLGATTDYDEYKPHITISYGAGEITEEMLKPFTLDIKPVIIEEYYEPLDLKWKDKLK
ncbi:MAG: hypothetical protein ACRC3J_05420 [Culicoidibacterales bacterium]